MTRRWRGIDTDPGWINRRFADLDAKVRRLSSAKGLEASSVAGGVITVREILTDPASVIGFENGDTTTYSGVGDLTIALTHVPIAPSLQVKQNGHELEPTEWTLDSSSTVTVTAAAVTMLAGDVFTAWYAYDTAGAAPARQAPGTIFDFAGDGPWLLVGVGDMTDYSAPGLDDTTWDVVPWPVGHPIASAGDPSWPDPTTDTPSSSVGFWLRAHVEVLSACTLSVSARTEGQWWLYVDGILVDSDTAPAAPTAVGPVEIEATAGGHVVALHIDDVGGIGTQVYGDIAVEVV